MTRPKRKVWWTTVASDEKAASPAPSGEQWLTGSIDFGYRWLTDVRGNVQEYRSVVNLGEGPKLFGLDPLAFGGRAAEVVDGEWLRDCIAKENFPDFVVCGDFNVAPEDIDVYDTELWRGAIMASDGERAAFRELCSLGLRDTLRIHHEEGELFSWWDYQMRAFEKNRGLRIDAVLTSESLAKKCIASGIDREMRGGKDPSDHAPVWAEFAT